MFGSILRRWMHRISQPLPHGRRTQRRRPPSYRPRLDALEPRWLLSVTERVVHPFGSLVDDGLQPEGDVTLSSDGSVLYGRAYLGGSNNLGAIFQVNTDGTGYQLLHTFSGQPSSDGALPRHNAMVLSADGTQLYGMTEAGGSNDIGVVFRYDLSAPPDNAYEVIHSFQGAEGSTPHGSLIFNADGSLLYGMASLGGDRNKGVLFAMDPSGNVNVLYSFGQTPDGTASAAFGTEPHATPLLVGSHLYGMTRKGGVDSSGNRLNFGVLYDFDLSNPDPTSQMQILHTFGGLAASDGATPYHGNLLFNDNFLYGMTTEGGTGSGTGDGIAFRYDLDPSDPSPYQILHFFAPGTTDGTNPEGTLCFAGGQLYGVTATGGAFNHGAFFRMNMDGSGFEVLYSFQNPDGNHPIDSVVPFQNIDGSITFYGMTQQGGIHPGTKGFGVIYAITVTEDGGGAAPGEAAVPNDPTVLLAAVSPARLSGAFPADDTLIGNWAPARDQFAGISPTPDAAGLRGQDLTPLVVHRLVQHRERDHFFAVFQLSEPGQGGDFFE